MQGALCIYTDAALASGKHPETALAEGSQLKEMLPALPDRGALETARGGLFWQ